MPPKSIFRQPGAKHFQLVHRSQRDPLINDPEASDRVLKPFDRQNTLKGKSRADLERDLSNDESYHSRENVGEASLYGVYFDDTEYDYMRHLRTVGVQEDGVESILIEAPTSSGKKSSKNQRKQGIDLLDLPDGVLASTSELPRTYESQQAIPSSISGFQPDMDAHLRQVLEALEDDAFVDDDLEDDFFGELVADGERGSDEEVDFDFTEEAFEGEAGVGDQGEEPSGWEKDFANFKKSQARDEGSDDGFDSEGGDTVGTLPAISVIGGKKRRKGSSVASGYSMSSSSMFRNEALQTLDERFDQMIMKQYNEEDEEEGAHSDDGDSDEAPELITARDDFDSMVNTFLNDFEILGRKMKPRLEGDSGLDKLDSLRRAMGQDERIRLMNNEGDSDHDDEEIDAHLFPDDGDKKDRWDCETILTTYSNLENHPRLIRARESKPVPKIVLDRKTGMPSARISEKATIPKSRSTQKYGSDNTDDSDDEVVESRGQAVGRPRDETKEEKKARKAATKAERQARRIEKKTTKTQFGAEVKDQKKMIGNKELRLKKL